MAIEGNQYFKSSFFQFKALTTWVIYLTQGSILEADFLRIPHGKLMIPTHTKLAMTRPGSMAESMAASISADRLCLFDPWSMQRSDFLIPLVGQNLSPIQTSQSAAKIADLMCISKNVPTIFGMQFSIPIGNHMQLFVGTVDPAVLES